MSAIPLHQKWLCHGQGLFSRQNTAEGRTQKLDEDERREVWYLGASFVTIVSKSAIGTERMVRLEGISNIRQRRVRSVEAFKSHSKDKQPRVARELRHFHKHVKHTGVKPWDGPENTST